MTPKHTPLPWTHEGNGVHQPSTAWNIYDAEGRLILTERNEDRAAFIVLAVNSHEVLLEAAKNIVMLASGLNMDKCGWCNTSKDHLKVEFCPISKLEKAIAQAEGK